MRDDGGRHRRKTAKMANKVQDRLLNAGDREREKREACFAQCDFPSVGREQFELNSAFFNIFIRSKLTVRFSWSPFDDRMVLTCLHADEENSLLNLLRCTKNCSTFTPDSLVYQSICASGPGLIRLFQYFIKAPDLPYFLQCTHPPASP